MNVRVLDGNGSALGTMSVIAAVVAFPSVDFYTLPAGGPLNVGYALIESSDFRAAMVNAVLTQQVPGRPDFQASVPSLDRTMDLMRFPFRNRRPFTTTVATASSFVGTDLTAIARDSSGLELCRNSFFMAEGDHTALILSDVLPCTADRDGLVEITADFLGVTAIAFLFNDFGAFTTQIPFEICCIF